MFANSYGKARSNKFLRFLFRSPARVSIFAFMILIGFGTLLLMLPAASEAGPLSFIDALFTATSASCVTGLTIVDTGQSFSFFGQVVILFLIQAGGLGIMTLSTLFILVAGRRLSMAGKIVIQDTFTNNKEQGVYRVVKEVILFTFILEGLGTIILFFQFYPGHLSFEAFYYSLFHSVSAFCNAGFSLFSDSFIQYQNDWIINSVLCFLIICGGIGFIVISELRRHFFFEKWSWKRISFHSKITLSTTFILIVLSTLLFFMMEWKDTLYTLSMPERMLASFFHAVSARTAGFNTLPIGNMANETLFFLIILMFIGASPGSCGGGIKTTTVAVLAILGISRLRGRQHPRVFNRTIPEPCTAKAMSIVMMSMFVVVMATLAILMSELGSAPHPETRGKFLELFFEVVSAFGTVGLSTGITTGLSLSGKLIITLVMFIGRLGPLVVALAISREKDSRVYYAEENIMIG